MDEDKSLATITLILLIMVGVLGCLIVWFRMRYSEEHENGFISVV